MREVRADAGGWFGPRRLVTLVRYGEGPHLASLLFLPLAIGLLHVALEKRRPLHYVLAALAVAAVVLSNWIGGFALALAVAAYLAAFGGWLRAAAIGVYAYALALPWVTPSTIATIRANAPLVGGRFVPSLKLEILFVLGFVAARLGLARARLARARASPCCSSMAPRSWPWRHTGSTPACCRSPSATTWKWTWHSGWRPRCMRCRGCGAASPGAPLRSAALIGLRRMLAARCCCLSTHGAQPWSSPSPSNPPPSTKSPPGWARTCPAAACFAPGTIGFWMNAFSDTPMLVGGFDNGMRNTFLQDVIYQIYAGDKQQVMLDWLEAFGCDAIVGDGRRAARCTTPTPIPRNSPACRSCGAMGRR